MIFPMMALVQLQLLWLLFNAPVRELTVETGAVNLDPWLSPFKDTFKRRYSKAQEWIKRIDETEGGLDKFSKVRTRGSSQTSLATR